MRLNPHQNAMTMVMATAQVITNGGVGATHDQGSEDKLGKEMKLAVGDVRAEYNSKCEVMFEQLRAMEKVEQKRRDEKFAEQHRRETQIKVENVRE